ncbi:MAG: cofactor-independent phosphoglycerate mutase [Candidatus Omnitrophica bacterium]|nr:cofactor-independent phosphoglycerate mutase [Candidatus Omnitrophota bacterium]
MKYIVIVPDGAADHPLDSLGQKTPLEAAETPNMDLLAQQGTVGRVKTVPRGFVPSSDVANLSLMGYDPEVYYSGRAPLEAANLGIPLSDDDLAFRLNFITESDGKVLDYSAGHIKNKESKALIDSLSLKFGSQQLQFYHGQSYRNLLVVRGGAKLGLDKVKYFAPHDIMGQSVEKNFPKDKRSQEIVDLMRKSGEFLENHEINRVRIDLGESPANMIWLWGCGRRPNMPLFRDKFGVSGSVISAVDLINGMGKIIGLDVLKVEGVTGYYDTNYRGKADAALKSLETKDFVFVHIEAPDEAGHNQDLRMKIICIERIDKFVVGPILKAMTTKDFRILISPDHPTPVMKRTHTNEPVPFVMFGSGIDYGGYTSYCEKEAATSKVYYDKGDELISFFLKK